MFAPHDLDNLPPVACPDCDGRALCWIPVSQQALPDPQVLVGCLNCQSAFVLDPPERSEGVKMELALAETPGRAIVCPYCGAREVGLLPKSTWRRDQEGEFVAFGCKNCGKTHQMEAV